RQLLRVPQPLQAQSSARFLPPRAGLPRVTTETGRRGVAATSAAPAALSSFALARGKTAGVGLDDTCDELVADDVLMCERHVADSLDAVQQFDGLCKARCLAVRQVNLAWIARDDHAAVFAQPREKHFHLHGRCVLRFVENDGSV